MQPGQQRVPPGMLGKISAEIECVMQTFGAEPAVEPLAFNRNYFELSGEHFGLCFSCSLQNPVPIYQLPSLDNIRARRTGPLATYQHRESFCAEVILAEGAPAHPAIVLNSDIGGPRNALDTLIREAIHMYSHNSQGFQSDGFISEWNSPPLREGSHKSPAGLNKHVYTVLDNGTRELFARIVSNHLGHDDTPPVATRRGRIPDYEYPLRVVCDLAADLGPDVVASAYFSGDRRLQGALIQRAARASDKSRYGCRYFALLSDLDIASDRYTPPNASRHANTGDDNRARTAACSTFHSNAGRIEHLNKLGVYLPQPRQLLASIDCGAYADPAIAFWRQRGNDSPAGRKHPAESAISTAAAVYNAYRLVGSSRA